MSDLLSQSTRLVVLVPFLAALLGLSVARRRLASAAVAVTGGVVTLFAATYVLYGVHHGPFTPEVSTIGALPLGRLQMPLHLLLDDLSAIVVVAVAIVGLTIQLFTTWYLHDDDRYGAFHDLPTWRAAMHAAAFEELEHYYRPEGLPRGEQPWLASVWRRSA